MKKATWLGALLLALTMVSGLQLPSEAVARSVTIYLDPKIIDPGTNVAPASDAAARGSIYVVGDAGDKHNIRLQSRPVNSTDPWTTISTYLDQPSSSTIYFNGWQQSEYRAVMIEGTNVYSPIKRYTWVRTFVDEFSSTSLDPAKWAHRRPNTYNTASGGTCSKNSADGVTFTGNTIKLASVPDTAPVPPATYTQEQLDFCATHGWYKDSMIGTQGLFEQEYGWMSARIKFHRWHGGHTAFWTQHVNGYNAPGGEIDIAEFFGSDGTLSEQLMYHNMYCDWNGDKVMESVKENTSTEGAGLKTASPDNERFWNMYNVFTMSWTPTRVNFYINGKYVQSINDPDFAGLSYMILSNQVRDYEIPKRMHGTYESTYVMEVDWVQAWAYGG